MAKLAILKVSAAKLLDGIAKFKKLQDQFHDDAHVLAVSVMFHAAEHGDVRTMNNFYNVLSKNYQTAYKLYWARIAKEHPEVAFLTFNTKEGFKVKKDVEKEKTAFMAFAEEILIEGEKFKRFYERDIVVETILLSNASFTKKLNTLLKQAKGESENVESKVDPKLIKELETLVAHSAQTAGIENPAVH